MGFLTWRSDFINSSTQISFFTHWQQAINNRYQYKAIC